MCLDQSTAHNSLLPFLLNPSSSPSHLHVLFYFYNSLGPLSAAYVCLDVEPSMVSLQVATPPKSDDSHSPKNHHS